MKIYDNFKGMYIEVIPATVAGFLKNPRFTKEAPKKEETEKEEIVEETEIIEEKPKKALRKRRTKKVEKE